MSDAEKRENVFDSFKNVGVSLEFVIQEAFLGYKYRKDHKKLYDTDSVVPEQLIRLYYGMNPDEARFDTMKQSFINKYIKNESIIEGINVDNIHTNTEARGLAAMYEYIHSSDIDYLFDVYTLKDLHAKLFSYAEFPECAGFFRNYDVYLPGSGADLCSWYMIRSELDKVDKEVQKLMKTAPIIGQYDSMEALFAYMDRAIEVACKLIKIHPFVDGNGRTIRGFLNKLFENVGLPPVYIKVHERTEYHRAMNKANNDGDYTDIKNFYRYKICDSIIEFDINERMRNNSGQTISNSEMTLKRKLNP